MRRARELRCGALLFKDVTAELTDGIRRRGLNVARVRARGGDSGTTAFSRGGVALGLLTSGGTQMSYTQISVATEALGDPVITGRPRSRAPTAAAERTDQVTSTSARLRGVVHPRGQSTTWRFDCGPTTSYGNQTAQQTISPNSDARRVTATISGLQPGTTYHFRVTATNVIGTRTSGDVTFTTLP